MPVPTKASQLSGVGSLAEAAGADLPRAGGVISVILRLEWLAAARLSLSVNSWEPFVTEAKTS